MVEELSVEEAPEIREVVEYGTNMSFTPDHEENLECARLHEAELEDARDEVAAQQQSINEMNDQMVMLEHAVVDREQEMVDQSNSHHAERTKEHFANQEAKAALQKNIDELEQAIRQNGEAIEDLEGQKAELKESHELAIADKEAQIEETLKEHQAMRDDLHSQIEQLQTEVQD